MENRRRITLNGKTTWLAIALAVGGGSIGGYALDEKITSAKEQLNLERQERVEMKNDISQRLDRIQSTLNHLLDMHLRK